MIKKRFYPAFTLVELIVVITILAILGTIAFISLGGYAVIARETARLTDINVISRALDLSYTENGFYPETASGSAVTFSGSTLWNQGYFSDAVRSKLGRISETPVDALIGTPYIYSVTYNRQEYQLGGGGEKGSPIASLDFIPQTSAFFSKAIVKGNYNGVILGKEIDNQVYIFGVPSIITQSTSSLDIQIVYTNKLYVLDNFSALPLNFASTPEEQARQIDFTLQNSDDYILYVGTKEDIATGSGILNFSQKLYTLYDDTVLENQPSIITLVNPTLNTLEAQTARVSQIAQYMLAVQSVRNIVPVSGLQSLVQSSGSIPAIPPVNNFNFSNLNNQEVDMQVYSETLLISDIDSPLSLSISGSGSPAFQIDDADWLTSGTISAGQTIRLGMMTPSSHNTANTINFTFGSENMTWTTTTRDFATCPIESQNLVFNIPDSDMQNGASYEGQGQCTWSGSLQVSYGTSWNTSTNPWTRYGFDAQSVTNSCVHGGTLNYLTGPRAGQSDACMCTIHVQCVTSGVVPVGYTW